MALALCVWFLSGAFSLAFVTTTTPARRPRTTLTASESEPEVEVITETTTTEVLGGSLDRAMAKLSEGERYESVILSALSRGDVGEALTLLDEVAVPSAKVARQLIDTCASAKDPDAFGFLAANDNKRRRSRKLFQRFGSWRKTAKRRGVGVKLKEDDRLVEMSVALATFLAFASSGLGIAYDSLLGLDPTLPDVALLTLLGAAGLDVVSNEAKVVTLAAKGADRLLGTDPQREAEVEAAALLVGYVLGVPSFAYSPTAFQAISLVEKNLADAATTLTWLAAPLAAELVNHENFRSADPRQCFAFLDVAKQRDWLPGEPEEAALLDLAATEATNILNSNALLHSQLSTFFKSNAATAGDCVVLIENASGNNLLSDLSTWDSVGGSSKSQNNNNNKKATFFNFNK